MFDAIIERLLAVARGDRDGWARDGWRLAAAAVAPDAAPFVAWARAHRRWSFVVAEAADEVCAKPPEAAAYIAHAIVEELLADED
ncbi:MAG TPA: hypothetical protein VIA18_16875 [Polyangia bacterium]|jgi:hypothetical protein|nr:hypothetical protein [Polyangia bacterium]